jgi:predicted double-glycine peptidase
MKCKQPVVLEKNIEKDNVALQIPFYRQSYEFTCGPSCIIMAMKYFDRKLYVNQELEIDIWREANLIEAYATSHYGLALAAYKRGFHVRTCGNARSIRLLDTLCRSCKVLIDRESRTVYCGIAERPVNVLDHRLCLMLDPENRKFAIELLHDLQNRCHKIGIPDSIRHIELDDIPEWLENGFVPIVLVDARLVNDENVPHWVVITGMGTGEVTFNDPLASTGGSKVTVHEFLKHFGFNGATAAVILEGKL